MLNCTFVCGNAARIASGNPLSPSTQTMKMSSTPRSFRSVRRESQNLAPFGLAQPQAQQFLAALEIHVDGDIRGVL
jgi:hypothetical protein